MSLSYNLNNKQCFSTTELYTVATHDNFFWCEPCRWSQQQRFTDVAMSIFRSNRR